MIVIDTNVLICACDQADPTASEDRPRPHCQRSGRRPPVAGRLRIPRSSRKLDKQGFTPAHAWNRLGEFRDLLPLVMPTDGNLTRARELHITRGASRWDALILAACVEAGVEILYSEDLPGFEDFEGVRVVNPFK